MNNREAFEALEENKGRFLPRSETGYRDSLDNLKYQMFCLGWKAFAENNICSRSHPHDDMSETCKWLSVEAKKACLASQAQQPTDLSKQLREYAADSGYSHNDYADTMLAAASEIERCAARLAASQAQQEPLKVSENWREPLSADAMQRLKNLGVLDKSPAPEGDKE